MKIEKNKLVFSMVLACILLFLVGYAMLVWGEDKEPTTDNNQIPVPELEDNLKEYDSKLDALNDLKEVKQTNAPSIYDERLLDSTGVYDAQLLDKEKMRVVDSIYQHGQIRYSGQSYENINPKDNTTKSIKKMAKDTIKIDDKETEVASKELALEHQLFFASHPITNEALNAKNTDESIYVRVDGTQTLKANYRLQMRLTNDAILYGKRIPKNTLIYGFISFKPNRTIIDIEHINHQPVKLKAYDYQDGTEGIYVENSFQEEATREVLDDVISDFNIPSVPQVGGLTQVFRHSNRRVKVTILNNYKLILKPKL
ncbi:conjugative transposon protein TraM [Maribacter polysaccharolyticus]|uniref:conjugative transposon protein TraM n=1 Tax=Maribacter polysaccharolyticus TaxID=3020831 RepID=UPI00237F99CD|nr:conjugative transposon protein TraM [Maribacter polysaccharolyticus]MDE3741184.1 conjugative transposon protein TraM [Maribacter polysaccharolyticus]